MNCDQIIHDELKEMSQLYCDFCDLKLEDNVLKKEEGDCCENMELIKDDGMNVCINCGLVDGYDLVNEYIEFYDNMYRIRRKSVDHRKYHIENVLDSLSLKHDIEMTYKNGKKILRIFELIDKVLRQVNIKHKRMIKINYIFAKIIKILKVPCDNIPLPKSKKTLRFYKQWWNQVYELIKDDINKIIQS